MGISTVAPLVMRLKDIGIVAPPSPFKLKLEVLDVHTHVPILAPWTRVTAASITVVDVLSSTRTTRIDIPKSLLTISPVLKLTVHLT